MDIPTSDDVEMAAGTPKRAQAPSGPSRPGTVARRALGMSSGDGHVHFLVIILNFFIIQFLRHLFVNLGLGVTSHSSFHLLQ
jgi:hypothetical protein